MFKNKTLGSLSLLPTFILITTRMWIKPSVPNLWAPGLVTWKTDFSQTRVDGFELIQVQPSRDSSTFVEEHHAARKPLERSRWLWWWWWRQQARSLNKQGTAWVQQVDISCPKWGRKKVASGWCYSCWVAVNWPGGWAGWGECSAGVPWAGKCAGEGRWAFGDKVLALGGLVPNRSWTNNGPIMDWQVKDQKWIRLRASD